MKHTTISSSVLFDRRNNPSLRWDAGFAIALGTIVRGEDLSVEEFYDILPDHATVRVWKESLRKKETIEQVKNHILLALIGRKSKFDEVEYPVELEKKFSKEVLSGVEFIARKLCSASADEIESEIAEDTKRIKNLRSMANEK